MRSPTSLVILLAALASSGAQAAPGPAGAAAAEIWPVEVAPLDTTALAAQRTRIDQAATTLPPELAPAVRYQKTFSGILSGAPAKGWSGEVTRMAEATGDDAMTRGLREVGKFWVARLAMDEINAALRGFYLHEIRFPENLSLIQANLPPGVQRDPWGEPWVYKLKAPAAFGSLNGQGYALGPARMPSLSLLRHVQQPRHLVTPAWKVTVVTAGGRPALEFRNGGNVSLIQPGGVADGCVLLFIGEDWALLAQVDQLFAVAF